MNVPISLNICSVNNGDNQMKNVQIAMNLTLPHIHRSLSQIQMELNSKKCGSYNWIYFNQSVNLEDIKSTDEYILLNTEHSIGEIEVDNHQYLVESKINLRANHNSSPTQNVKNENTNVVSLDIFLKEIKINAEEDSISEIWITTYKSFYSISTSLFIVVSVSLKMYYAYKYEMYHLFSKYPHLVHLKTYALIILLPIIFVSSIFDAKMLNDVWPLSLNIFIYFVANILSFIISVCIICFIVSKFDRIWNKIHENDDNIFLFFLCWVSISIHFLYLILPEWLSIVVSWCNWRLLMLMITSNVILNIVVNVAVIRRMNRYISDSISINHIDLLVSLVIKLQWMIDLVYHINLTVYLMFLLYSVWCIIMLLQIKYRSRIIKFDYRRRIWEDFDLTRMVESEWPEWDLWMCKLHETSLFTNDRSLRDIEGIYWYEKYMRTVDWGNLHYFCLEWLINNSMSFDFLLLQ